MNLFHLLEKPHPFIYNRSSVLLPGAVTFLFIGLIAPFGFDQLSLIHRLGFALLFGVVASLCVMGVVTVMRRLTPRFMQPEVWTVGKEISLILLVLGVICLVILGIFKVFAITEMTTIKLFQSVVLKTLLISLFPITILVLFEQITHQRKKLHQAKSLTERLRERSMEQQNTAASEEHNFNPSRSTGWIQFAAENNKVELQLKPEEVLFLKSEGNYVEVHYLNASGIAKKKLIRNRLKSFREHLPGDQFFHCHRSYVVNAQHIQRVEGNARNFELLLRATAELVPVSRSKSDALSDFF